MAITINISTISREKQQYLFQTLTSLLASDFPKEEYGYINLKVGNMDNNYLESFMHHKFLNINVPEQGSWDTVKDKGKCEKFNFNFLRCLESDGNVLYLEDDIIFKETWWKELKQAIFDLEYALGNKFILSLYSPYDLSSHKENYVVFENSFFGTQGVYFPKATIEGFAKKILEEGIDNYRHMADLLLQEYCNDNDIKLICMKNSIIQHIGVESSIHTNQFHNSKTF